MTLLFVLGSPEYLRYYDSTLELLSERGHRVAVAVNSAREKKFVRLEGLQVLAGRVDILGVAPAPSGLWRTIAHEVRGLMDFVRYLHPRFLEAPALRARMKRKALHPAFYWLDAIRALQQQMLDMQKQLAQIATGSYTPSTDKDKPQ